MGEQNDDVLSEHAPKPLLSSLYSNMSAQARELVELMRSSSVSGLFLTNIMVGYLGCPSALAWSLGDD